MKLDLIVSELLTDSAFWTDPQLPFTAHYTPGHPRTLLVLGENVSGKSLFVGGLLGWARAHHQVAPVEVSIRQRTGAGTSDIAGMRRTMMFGDESEQSTGATSTKVLDGAFGTVESRAGDGQPALLVLDEPELGLSDGYAQAMGTYLARRAQNLPERAAGLVIVTHNRALARAFARELGQVPSIVQMGTPGSWETWLAGEAPRSVEELLALPALGRTRQMAVHRLLSESRRKR